MKKVSIVHNVVKFVKAKQLGRIDKFSTSIFLPVIVKIISSVAMQSQYIHVLADFTIM